MKLTSEEHTGAAGQELIPSAFEQPGRLEEAGVALGSSTLRQTRSELVGDVTFSGTGLLTFLALYI